jgi:UDP:flavonoid glycosyltransferase YjiC (YdhE family)
MAAIILVTHGTPGDVQPFLAIGRGLRKRGHEVTLITHGPYAGAADTAGLSFVPIDKAAEYERQQRGNGDLLAELGGYDPAHILGFYEKNGLFRRVQRETEVILGSARGGEVVVLAHHTTGVSALLARELAAIPCAWIAVTPMQIMALPVTVALYQDVLAARMNTARGALGLPAIDDWAGWFSSVDARVGLWPEWFDCLGTRALPGTELAGFAPDDESEGGALPDGLGDVLRQRPILIGGTTGHIPRAGYYEAAIEGALGHGVPVVVMASDPALVPTALRAQVHWFPWLPYRDVMPHVSCAVHHGGIGTIARAVAAGVPQVILAFGFDRPDNAARLARGGLATRLPAALWTARHVHDAIRHERGRTISRPGPASGNATTTVCAFAERLLTQRAADRLSPACRGGTARWSA